MTLEPIPAEWTDEISEVNRICNTQLQELRRQARHDPLPGLVTHPKGAALHRRPYDPPPSDSRTHESHP